MRAESERARVPHRRARRTTGTTRAAGPTLTARTAVAEQQSAISTVLASQTGGRISEAMLTAGLRSNCSWCGASATPLSEDATERTGPLFAEIRLSALP